jgi:hypothetical protein
MKPGIPIVRFKFITKGETLGLAFDGLVYLDGRGKSCPNLGVHLDKIKQVLGQA